MRQFKVNDELINKIKKLINNDSKDKLINILDELHYADLAEIFESLEIIEVIFLVKIFDKEKIADALAEIDEDLREIILENLSEKEIAEKIEELDTDDATDVIQDLPEELQEEVLNVLKDNNQSSDISILMNYDENSAGGIMDLDFVSANWNWSVKNALQKLREQVENVDQIYTIYVVDSAKKFKGILSLKRFLYAKDDTLIKDLF